MERTAFTTTDGHVFEFLGGRLCLDFINTMSGMRVTNPRERLKGYPDLVAWAVQARVLDPEQGGALLAAAQRRPQDAQATFRQAIALREALHEVFQAGIEGRPPAAADLERINRALARALSRRRLTATPAGFELGWERAGEELDAMLWPVAGSAADLLVSGEVTRVHVCGESEAGRCGWLFLDETKSGTRRWCSMRDCGNRAKARRHYQRVRAER